MIEKGRDGKKKSLGVCNKKVTQSLSIKHLIVAELKKERSGFDCIRGKVESVSDSLSFLLLLQNGAWLVVSDDVNPAFALPIQIAFLPMDDGDAHNFLNPDCDRLIIIQEFGGTPSNDLLIFDVFFSPNPNFVW